MIPSGDALARLAAQHVDDMHGAEALTGAVDRRERLLRGDGRVPGLGRLEAGVAVAARSARLAEVGEQAHATAARRLAQAEQRIELGGADPLVFVARLRLVDEPPLLDEIGESVRHPGVGGEPVAASAAGFLVVGLDRFGQVEMGDEAHVRLVDAHAERDGRHHDDAVLALESRLVRGTRLRVHARVVGQRGDAVADEPRRRLLHLPARQAIDDARVARMLVAQEREQLRARLGLVDDRVADVRPVEAGDEDARVVEGEARDDLGARLRVGGRGEGDARHAGEALVQHGELQVLRPEVVAPLRDAVRLVDGEEREPSALQEIEAPRRDEPLGRDVEQIELAATSARSTCLRLGRDQRRVEERRAHAGLSQRRRPDPA